MTRRPAAFLLAALALAELGTPPAARAIGYRCPNSPLEIDLAIVFANGMNTDVGDARDNLAALKDPIIDMLDAHENAIEWGIAYNMNEGWADQFVEVVRQRLQMSPSHYMRVLAGLEAMPEAMQEALERAAADHDLQAFTFDEDLARHVLSYRDHLARGRNVLVVAHSQGNLYANAAYDALLLQEPQKAQDHFAIVGVASPAPDFLGRRAARCPSRGCYTTLEEDAIIRAVRAALWTTLPATTRDATDTGDPLRHAFLDTYLALASTRGEIFANIEAQLADFADLEPEVPSGPITASLAWSARADLDLHVYEVDGRAHVFHASPEGFVGSLDRDSRDGAQPENYRAACEHLRAGTYELGVNYYAGQGPLTATLRLTAGSAVRTFTRELPAPRGQAGDADPEPFGWLIVEEGPGRWFDFTLLPYD